MPGEYSTALQSGKYQILESNEKIALLKSTPSNEESTFMLILQRRKKSEASP
jgi:hypothetical protein